MVSRPSLIRLSFEGLIGVGRLLSNVACPVNGSVTWILATRQKQVDISANHSGTNCHFLWGALGAPRGKTFTAQTSLVRPRYGDKNIEGRKKSPVSGGMNLTGSRKVTLEDANVAEGPGGIFRPGPGGFWIEREGRPRSAQPFTPPAVRPPTIHFWQYRKMMVIGSPESTAAAAKSPHR